MSGFGPNRLSVTLNGLGFGQLHFGGESELISRRNQGLRRLGGQRGRLRVGVTIKRIGRISCARGFGANRSTRRRGKRGGWNPVAERNQRVVKACRNRQHHVNGYRGGRRDRSRWLRLRIRSIRRLRLRLFGMSVMFVFDALFGSGRWRGSF